MQVIEKEIRTFGCDVHFSDSYSSIIKGKVVSAETYINSSFSYLEGVTKASTKDGEPD